MGQRLDDILVRNVAPPETGNRIIYDAPNKRGGDWTPGFGLRVTATGARAFILNYRTKDGVERRHTIGRYPDWSLAAARDEARKLNAKLMAAQIRLRQTASGATQKRWPSCANGFSRNTSAKNGLQRKMTIAGSCG